MSKRPAKRAANLNSVKTTGEKATVSMNEKETVTKEVVTEAAKETVKEVAAEPVKETVKAVVEAKAEEVKAVVKEEEKKVVEKAAEAKNAVKKTVKKAAAKPAAKVEEKKTELKPEIFVQFNNQEDVVADIVERAKAAYVADGHRASAIKSLQVYLKPEEHTAYYVVNQKYAGKVYMF